jgi:hypothetical protein
MKISVDIDCTPEEARRFMGLPDMAPVHNVYLDRLKTTLESGGVSPDTVQSLVKNWAPMGEAGLAIWRQVVDQLGTAAAKKP